MKKRILITLIVAVPLLCAATLGLAWQQATERLAAFRVAGATPDKYVTAVPKGGLDANGGTLTARQVFTLVDLNGGTLKDGDSVKIKFGESFWREDKEKGHVRRASVKNLVENECTFKLRKRGKLFALQTPSGKFISSQAEAASLLTMGEEGDATRWALVLHQEGEDEWPPSGFPADLSTPTPTPTPL